MAKTLTQGDIRSWAKLQDYWTPLRMTIARASALAENRFIRASGNRHAKCAPFHEHYWTVEQIEQDLDEAGFVIVERAELDRLKAAAERAPEVATVSPAPDPDPQPVRRGPGRPRKIRTED